MADFLFAGWAIFAALGLMTIAMMMVLRQTGHTRDLWLSVIILPVVGFGHYLAWLYVYGYYETV